MLNLSIKHLVNSPIHIHWAEQKLTADFGEVNLGVPFDVLAEFIDHTRTTLDFYTRWCDYTVEEDLESLVITSRFPNDVELELRYTSTDFGLRFRRNLDQNSLPLGFPLEWIKLALEAIKERPLFDNSSD